MKIKTAGGQEAEYKLYFNDGTANSNMVFENQAPGMGAVSKEPTPL